MLKEEEEEEEEEETVVGAIARIQRGQTQNSIEGGHKQNPDRKRGKATDDDGADDDSDAGEMQDAPIEAAKMKKSL